MDSLNISNLTNYTSGLTSNINTDSLKNKAQTAQTDEELMDACKEFENYLWEQVIKSMKDTINITGDEDSTSSQYVDYFMDTAISDVASSLTEESMGPNSLAQQMYEQMKRNNSISAESLLAQSEAVSTVISNNSEE